MAQTIDATALRDIVGEYDYRLCSKNDKDITNKCIEKGKTYVYSFYKKVGKESEYDEYNDTICEAILDRCCFELYIKGKMYELSEKKRIECQTKLIILLGDSANIYKKDEINSGIKTFGVVSRKGETQAINWKAY